MKFMKTIALSLFLALSCALPLGHLSPIGIAQAQQGPVSVRVYGAKGDGISNDTSAFTNALSANKTIFVPDGTYLIDQLNLDATADATKNGKHIICQSRKGTILKARTSATTKLVNVQGGGGNSSQGHIVEGCTFDMTNMTDNTSSYGIFLATAYNNVFRDLEVIGYGTNKRSLRANAGAYTTLFENIDFGSTAGRLELVGNSLADAVTTITFNSVAFGSAILTNCTVMTFVTPTVQGALDKFVLTSINGITLVGADVEGTGTYLNLSGGSVSHLVTVNTELSGFSGTYMSGSATSAMLQDFTGSQPFELVNGTAGIRITDSTLTVRKTAAALHRSTYENTNAAAQQVDIEFKSTPAGGSTYVGQSSAGKGFLDCRAGGGCLLQVGGADKLGVTSADRLKVGTLTANTVGAAGGASALPATPSGYLQIDVGGTTFKVPYYAN